MDRRHGTKPLTGQMAVMMKLMMLMTEAERAAACVLVVERFRPMKTPIAAVTKRGAAYKADPESNVIRLFPRGPAHGGRP